MSNLIRKQPWVLVMKPIYLCKVPEPAIKDIPCFTEMEMKWIGQNVKTVEEGNLLYLARQEDCDYQILPDAMVRKPIDPPPGPEAVKAMQECLDFVRGSSGK
jgi:hypothetical protein